MDSLTAFLSSLTLGHGLLGVAVFVAYKLAGYAVSKWSTAQPASVTPAPTVSHAQDFLNMFEEKFAAAVKKLKDDMLSSLLGSINNAAKPADPPAAPKS